MKQQFFMNNVAAGVAATLTMTMDEKEMPEHANSFECNKVVDACVCQRNFQQRLVIEICAVFIYKCLIVERVWFAAETIYEHTLHTLTFKNVQQQTV